jgi:hypothetical protein
VVAITVALVAVLVRVSLTPGTKAPVGSFTEPAILPTGDAHSQAALRNTIAANRIERKVEAFIETTPCGKMIPEDG